MINDQNSRSGRPAGAPIPREAKQPPRILVVDDDVDIRQLGTEVLIHSGYAANAADGAGAWQALNGDSYDLLITDHKLPQASGVELIRKMRAARMDLPVIMTSAQLPTDEFATDPWLQPDASLRKPFTVVEFLVTVSETLRITRTSRNQIAPATTEAIARSTALSVPPREEAKMGEMSAIKPCRAGP